MGCGNLLHQEPEGKFVSKAKMHWAWTAANKGHYDQVRSKSPAGPHVHRPRLAKVKQMKEHEEEKM